MLPSGGPAGLAVKLGLSPTAKFLDLSGWFPTGTWKLLNAFLAILRSLNNRCPHFLGGGVRQLVLRQDGRRSLLQYQPDYSHSLPVGASLITG